MLDLQIRFLAHDFKGGKLPKAVGDKAIVKAFMGQRNVPVIVTEVLTGAVMAKIDWA